ncbi:MAG TPA: hypothetical protein VLJ59_19535 [Mycobacteriales bacterium]|nr:hypothetical protein [Mycobacteriales bacterium]
MRPIVYDAGALVAAERRRSPMWAFHDLALAAGVVPIVPVVVLAQAWRGGPQAELSRLLRGCRVEPDDEQTGRGAGLLCSTSRTSDVVDAIVVVTAIRRDAVVVTSNPGDLSRLADALDAKLQLHLV